MSGRRRTALPALLLALFAALPLLSVLGRENAYLASSMSELPVKIWVYETFGFGDLLGGQVDSIGFPNTGPLNNPDPVGTVVFGLLKPLLGSVGAYNTFVFLQLYAAMLATWALARDLVRDDWAALTAAVAFGLTPLLLVYPVAGGITDMLNVWPYPLAMLFTLRALRRPGWRDGLLGGAFAGVGFVTCPYNFVIFAAMVVPALLWLPIAWRVGLSPVPDPGALPSRNPERWRQLGRATLGLAVGVGLVGGLFALKLRTLMEDPTSQMSTEMVAQTRHSAPYLSLWPPKPHRYVAFLSDYFVVGKDALIVRDLGARFYRAFSPGWLVFALAGWGLFRGPVRRAALLWPTMALFAMVVSTGPYLPFTERLCYPEPVNLAWLALHHGFPGADLILEPFRYGLPAALALAIAAAVGVHALALRLGRWVSLALPVAIVAELVVLSPVPVPLPVFAPRISPAYALLDEAIPPGAVIELPYTDRGSARFVRTHFLNQLVHGRPIANEVQGFLPRYLVENAFTSRILSIENRQPLISVQYTDEGRYHSDRLRLPDHGFAAVVVDESAFEDQHVRREVMKHLAELGEPLILEDRLVFVLRSSVAP